MTVFKALVALALAAMAGSMPVAQAAGFEEDVEAVAALREAGADLTQPMLLEFIFRFDKREDARKMWRALSTDGYKAQVSANAGEPGFMVFARKSMLVEEAAIARLREQLEQQARKYNGVYEGWGAP